MSLKTLYLHVGMDKTGTSAIQTFCYQNKEKILKNSGIYYSNTGLWSDFSHHLYAFSLLELAGYCNQDFITLCSKLEREASKYSTVLISSECLFKTTIKPQFDLFLSSLFSIFDLVKVVVYVRRQDDWVESRYKHSIISGNEIALDTLKKPFFCDYLQYIDKWGSQVGRENVIVRSFDKSRFYKGSIFSDFMYSLGQEVLPLYDLPRADVNHSLNKTETEFKKYCNYLGLSKDSSDQLNVTLLEMSSSSDGHKGDFLSTEERRGLIATYSSINEQIASKYMGGNVKGLFSNAVQDDISDDEFEFNLSDDDVLKIGAIFKSRYPKAFVELLSLLEHAKRIGRADIQCAVEKLEPLRSMSR